MNAGDCSNSTEPSSKLHINVPFIDSSIGANRLPKSKHAQNPQSYLCPCESRLLADTLHNRGRVGTRSSGQSSLRLQRRYSVHLTLADLEVENVHVGRHSLRARAFRKHDVAQLKVPAQNNLAAVFAVASRDVCNDGILKQAELSAGKRRVRLQYDAFAFAKGFELGVLAVWMKLDLIDHRHDGSTVLQELFQVLCSEVAHANSPRCAQFEERAKRVPYNFTAPPGEPGIFFVETARPVHETQVNVSHLQRELRQSINNQS